MIITIINIILLGIVTINILLYLNIHNGICKIFLGIYYAFFFHSSVINLQCYISFRYRM